MLQSGNSCPYCHEPGCGCKQLLCKANGAVIARCYRYALYSICKIRPLLKRESARLLFQALISQLAYSLLAGLLESSIQPLKVIQIQNVAVDLSYPPKFSHIIPTIISPISVIVNLKTCFNFTYFHLKVPYSENKKKKKKQCITVICVFN